MRHVVPQMRHDLVPLTAIGPLIRVVATQQLIAPRILLVAVRLHDPLTQSLTTRERRLRGIEWRRLLQRYQRLHWDSIRTRAVPEWSRLVDVCA